MSSKAAAEGQLLLPWLLSLLLLAQIFHLSQADIGTASHYSPPYTPTACNGNDGSQFPTSNLFAAAGEGVWDNGAACGRQYLVRCINGVDPGACVPGKTIQVIIVDRAATAVSKAKKPGATIVLSDSAYANIAKATTASINIDYQQV